MMKKFSKLLALFLALVTVFTLSAEMLVFADEKTAEGTSEKATSETDDKSEEPVELPSSVTLVGTPHLPPVSNQGEIGTCASNSVTWVQFTNAVSRYIHSIDPDTDWNPSSGNSKYIFSPKFTFQYSGAGTSWVYDILKDHGCLTLDDCNFATNENGAFRIHVPGRQKIEEKTAGFEVAEGLFAKALKYRLTNYEQVWLNKNYTVGGKVAITTTEQGQKLINKVKEALYEGNVVVTGGYPSRWQISSSMNVRLTSTGNLAKNSRSSAILYSVGDTPGGHNVCIVGYDDDITVKYKGVTLKGAFQIMNSWGDEWPTKQDGGFVWMMYDALNEVSEFEELNVPGRTWTMDQLVFTYWDKDITSDIPDLMLEVECESNNRDGAAIGVVRKSENNGKTKVEYFTPTLFKFGPVDKNMHSTYDSGKYFTYSGKEFTKDGPLEKAYYTLDFNCVSSSDSSTRRALDIPTEMSFSDYEWGVRLYGCLGAKTVYKSVRLVTSSGVVLAELDLGEDGFTAPSSQVAKSETKYFEMNVTDVKLPEPEKDSHYTLEQTAGDKFLKIGETYSFAIVPEEGYTAESAVVTVNGNTVTPGDDGNYTVTATAKDTIEISGITEKSKEDTSDKNNSVNGVLIASVAGGVVAVVAIVGIAVGVSKKKKKVG